MGFVYDTISFVVALVVFLVILAIAGVVIVKVFVKKNYYGSGTQFIGRQVFTDFQNEDKKAAVEHVIYVEEDEREEAYGGEDFDIPDKNSKE